MIEQEFNWFSKADLGPSDVELVFRCLNCDYVIRPYRTMKLLKKWSSQAIANHWNAMNHSMICGWETIDQSKNPEEPRSHYFWNGR